MAKKISIWILLSDSDSVDSESSSSMALEGNAGGKGAVEYSIA